MLDKPSKGKHSREKSNEAINTIEAQKKAWRSLLSNKKRLREREGRAALEEFSAYLKSLETGHAFAALPQKEINTIISTVLQAKYLFAEHKKIGGEDVEIYSGETSLHVNSAIYRPFEKILGSLGSEPKEKKREILDRITREVVENFTGLPFELMRSLYVKLLQQCPPDLIAEEVAHSVAYLENFSRMASLAKETLGRGAEIGEEGFSYLSGKHKVEQEMRDMLLTVAQASLFEEKGPQIARALANEIYINHRGTAVTGGHTTVATQAAEKKIMDFMFRTRPQTEGILDDLYRGKVGKEDARRRFAASLQSFYEELKSKEDGNFLTTIIARARWEDSLNRLNQDDLRYDGIPESFPREIAHGRWGIYYEGSSGDVPLLILATEEESREMAKLAEEYTSLEDSVDKYRQNRKKIVEYAGYPEEWSPQVRDSYEYMYPEEIRQSHLYYKMRSYLFHSEKGNDERVRKNEWIGGYTCFPRKEKIIGIRQMLIQNGEARSWIMSDEQIEFNAIYPLFSGAVMTSLSKALGIELNQLSIRELFYWYRSMGKSINVTGLAMEKFCRDFGVAGLRTYLAAAFDDSASVYISKISAEFPKEMAMSIFAKFAEYVDTAEQVEASLVEVVEKTGQTNLHEVVRRSLLERATSFLRTCGTPPVSTMPVAERAVYIERELAKLSADASRTAAVSREIKKMGGTVTSEEVLGVRVRKVPATALRSLGRQYAQTEMMLKCNYKEDPNRGYQYTSQFREAIAKGAGALADKKDTTLFLATKDNEKVHDEDVLACLRFDEIKNKADKTERLYFGSFAADQAYMGGGFGEGLLKASFAETEAKYLGVPIDAHCDPRAPITQKYLEMGFVATGLEEYEQVPSFSITLDRDRNKRLGTKSFSLEQLMGRAQAAGNGAWNGTDVSYLYAGDTPPDFASLVGKKSGDRTLALTRYKIVEEKAEGVSGKKRYYAAFELL